MSMDAIFAGQYKEPPAMREVRTGDVTMLCSVTENGMGRIERLISPRPSDYLNPEWQPGQFVQLWPEES